MSEISFVADCMLGKLSKLLRMCGYDTIYYRGRDNNELVSLTVRQNRMLLTRKTVMIHRKDISKQLLFIIENSPPQQLDQVLKHYQLTLHPNRTFTICLICNHTLLTISPEKAEGRVPEYVLHTHRTFSQCPLCKKIFWKGSHFDKMQLLIDKIFSPSPVSDQSF